MARIVIKNALFYGSQKMDSLIIPWTTYTDPEIAHVGLYERDVKERFKGCHTLFETFEDSDRAICDGESEGFVKIFIKEGTDEILGATVVGSHAGEIISQITTAMQAKMGVSQFSSVIFPYPTRSSIFRKLGDQFNKSKLTPGVKILFRKVMSARR
eukprot:TRINITY_DN2213_c1_g1_i3.p1 TRINITY_DN2213_c1_g1~~TRINITY_DN2213_c1_g1_i3.p1  ORF type:complete len:156 (+),score=40.24 TRINITY_DN2213_c1_g1_i3:317-784(+)